MEERLQKLMARAGLASRRTAEALILAGSVRVNGEKVTRLGTKADPEKDRIEVEGKRLRFSAGHVYYLLNKPRGTVCTAHDPQKRPTIFSRLTKVQRRVFPVGRLPFEVDGLLLLTSDGAFSEAVLRGRLSQTYTLKIKRALNTEELGKLRQRAARYQKEPLRWRQRKRGANPWYEVTLVAPQSDWLRTLLFRLGHPVEKMSRTGIGLLRDRKLLPGRYRELTSGERTRLLREAETARPSGRRKKSSTRRTRR